MIFVFLLLLSPFHFLLSFLCYHCFLSFLFLFSSNFALLGSGPGGADDLWNHIGQILRGSCLLSPSPFLLQPCLRSQRCHAGSQSCQTNYQKPQQGSWRPQRPHTSSQSSVGHRPFWDRCPINIKQNTITGYRLCHCPFLIFSLVVVFIILYPTQIIVNPVQIIVNFLLMESCT